MNTEEKYCGPESWEKLLVETIGNSSRAPFTGTIRVHDQVLELFDRGNQFFFLADYSSRRMLYVSPNMTNILGYEPGEFVFRLLFEMVHPGDSKAAFDIGKMIINRELTYITGGSHRHLVLYMAYRVLRKNGRYTRISLTISRHIDPEGGIYEMGVIRDISHVRCGTEVTFSLLGGKQVKELPQYMSGGAMVSRREQEILFFISQGLTSKRIASELNLSQHTVNTHRRNIMRKTGAVSTVDLLLYAASNGII